MSSNIPALVAELRALEAKATPAVYEAPSFVRESVVGPYATVWHREHMGLDVARFRGKNHKDDATLYIKLRNTLPTLLDIIEEQGREIEQRDEAIRERDATIAELRALLEKIHRCLPDRPLPWSVYEEIVTATSSGNTAPAAAPASGPAATGGEEGISNEEAYIESIEVVARDHGWKPPKEVGDESLVDFLDRTLAAGRASKESAS